MLAAWPASGGRRLQLESIEPRRLTLRDARGVRLLDVHKEAGTALQLHLPSGAEISASERIAGMERPSDVERDIPEGETLLGTLSARPTTHSGRGEPPLFGLLFAEPFGRRAFARVQREATSSDELPSDVSARDVERLGLHLSHVSSSAKEVRITAALSLMLLGSIPSAALSFSLYKNVDHSSGWVDRTGFSSGVTLSAYTLCLGLYFLVSPWSEESLYDSFMGAEYRTERERARSVAKGELAFRDRAQSSQAARKVGAWVSLAGGAITFLTGAVVIGEDIYSHDPAVLQRNTLQ